MKGLEEYVAVYGRHFTEDLVKDAIHNRYSSLEVRRASEGQVYYNVSSATLGDMTFLANAFYKKKSHATLRYRLKLVYDIIGNVDMEGVAFTMFEIDNSEMDIDLRNYI